MNLWVHDGSKDLTVNRMLYRELLRDSLDRIFEQKYDHMKDCIESKVFGIGFGELYGGHNDFYIGYGASPARSSRSTRATSTRRSWWPTNSRRCCSSRPR